MDNREIDIQKLCIQVKEMDVEPHYDDDRGTYDYWCPFCDGSVLVYKRINNPMEEIKHTQECGYVLSKDLSTGIKEEDLYNWEE